MARKYQGGVIGGASKPISAGSAIRTEDTAVLEGLAWAKQMNFCSLIVETDSEELFEAVSGCVSSFSSKDPNQGPAVRTEYTNTAITAFRVSNAQLTPSSPT